MTKRKLYAREHDCVYCRDTGHAGGRLDDPNPCGWCDTKSIPIPDDMVGSWEFIFAHESGEKSFHRFNMPYAEALTEAKAGFQWQYGYWPSAPIKIKETSVGSS